MKTMLTTVLAGTLVLALAAVASAAVIWDGGEDPGTLAGYSTYGNASGISIFAWDDPCTGVMHQNSNNYDVWYWTKDFSATEMIRANGWFIQTRVEAISGGSGRGIFVKADDDFGRVDLDLTPSLLTVHCGNDSGVWGDPLTHALDAGYHTIKVVRPASTDGTTFDIYVDDMDTPVLSSVPHVTSIDSGAAGFGDGSTGGNGVADWDYFYVNYSGGPAPDPIPGDANGDDVVDDEDASILAAHWQQSGGWSEGDFNGDNVVNDQDASILAAHWQETREGGAPVPEPSVLVLLFGAGLIGLLARARRRR